MGRHARLDDALIDVERQTTHRSGYADWEFCPKCHAAPPMWEREPAMNHCRMCGTTVPNGGRIAEQIRFDRSYSLAQHTVDQDEGSNADRKRSDARKKTAWSRLWRQSR